MSGVCAYVIIEVEGGDTTNAVRKISEIEGVKQAHGLFGTVEAIAFVEASDLSALEKVVMKFRDVPGVKSTDTRIARIV